ncbi:DUF5666 domain-containing protein [Ideonella sp.]|uniref:DUF5666 domain-containing protein n=1 Tax=Ideonella sp. TaxID=1929293 RepID=UPI002B47E3B6|nr:DUF5666 domain-containing protein [Ideonella sp.]HJV68635.1 DUF5666 domain-containing protein [Ideonella sp.]
MSPTFTFGSTRFGAWRRIGLLGFVSVAAALLHACGGGVEGQGTGSVSSYSEGPIAGFGSIIVNGIHFDESQAAISDDDGNLLSAADLKLGMTVRIDGGAIDQTLGTAVADAVHVGSDLIGPVSANDVVGSTLTVLGQTVRVTASTVFDENLVGGQSVIVPGDDVEVFAILDPVSGVYAAQRIELKGTPSAYKLRGVVANLDTVQHTLQIGAASFSYAADIAPVNLANGQIVRLKLETTPDANGRWVITRFDDGAARPAEGDEVEIESVIASYTSNADFTLSGVRVNAASASIEPAGATLAAGVRVEVEGTMSGGVLIASKVEVKGSGDDGGDDSGGGRNIEIEAHISAIDPVAMTFVLREQVVDYSDAEIKNGTADDLAVDVKVKVHGQLSEDGTTVVASEVEIED